VEEEKGDGMMAAVGVAGAGPTLWMAIKARDQTKEAFDSVEKNFNRFKSTVLTTMGRVGGLATSFATLGRVTGLLSSQQAAAVGVFGTAIGVMSAVASTVKALTAIEWGFVTAKTWSVSLMTLGVGVAIAAAAAVAVLAMQTQNAAQAQREYNTELEKGTLTQRRVTAHRRMITRGGFAEATHI